MIKKEKEEVMYLLIFMLIVLAVLNYLSMRKEQDEDVASFFEDDRPGIIHPAEYCTRW